MAGNEFGIIKLAKSRYTQTKDIKQNKYIKHSPGKYLTLNKDIRERWMEYYKKLLNQEIPSKAHDIILPTECPVAEFSISRNLKIGSQKCRTEWWLTARFQMNGDIVTCYWSTKIRGT